MAPLNDRFKELDFPRPLRARQKKSAAEAILLEHCCWHQMVQTPYHLNRALLLKTHDRGRAEESEWSGSSINPFNASGKNENCVVPLLVVNQVLSGFAGLCRI